MNEFYRAQEVSKEAVTDLPSIFRDVIRGLRRNLWIILMCAALFAGLSAVYALYRLDNYVARTALLIDPRISNGFGGQQAPTILLADALVVDSEIEVLTSERLLRRVAELLPETDTERVTSDPLRQLLSWLPETSSYWGDEEVAPPSDEAILSNKVKWIRSNLEIEREGNTYVIGLKFRSQDPELSALVLNTLARQYLDIAAEDQVERATRATAWLSEQIEHLSSELEDAEAEAQQYRTENDIPISDVVNTVTQEIEAIDRDTIAARAAIRSAQSELQSITFDLQQLEAPEEIGSLTSVVLDDTRLASLQDQLRDVQRQSPENPTSNQRFLDSLIDQIRDELVRLRDTRESAIEVARTNLEFLSNERDALQQEIRRIETSLVPLKTMERQIAALQNRHSVLAEQLQGSLNEDRFVAGPARIIDPAVPPREPEGSAGGRFLLAGALGGAILGMGLAFFREQFDDRIRSSRDFIERLGLPYVGPLPLITHRSSRLPKSLIPLLENHPRRERKRISQLLGGAHHHPTRYGETLRRAASLLSNNSNGYEGCALITSLTDGEGKTTLAANLASFLAERGTDVLLVDGDPHTRMLSRLLSPDAPNEAPAGIMQLGSGLQLLHAASENNRDPTDHINAVRALLKDRAGRDEVVLIDGGPLTTAIDDLTDLHQVTKIFFVTRFGSVSCSTLRRILQQRPGIARKISGTFVSQMKERKLRLYEPLPI